MFYFSLEANHRLQTSIDKILNRFEETSKQLIESHSLQTQLADRLEENQLELSLARTKLLNVESENEERISELIEKLNQCESMFNLFFCYETMVNQFYSFKGLAESYKNEIEKKQRELVLLEQKLEGFTRDFEKSEISSVENVRNVQKSLSAHEFNDDGDVSDIKGLF